MKLSLFQHRNGRFGLHRASADLLRIAAERERFGWAFLSTGAALVLLLLLALPTCQAQHEREVGEQVTPLEDIARSIQSSAQTLDQSGVLQDIRRLASAAERLESRDEGGWLHELQDTTLSLKQASNKISEVQGFASRWAEVLSKAVPALATIGSEVKAKLDALETAPPPSSAIRSAESLQEELGGDLVASWVALAAIVGKINNATRIDATRIDPDDEGNYAWPLNFDQPRITAVRTQLESLTASCTDLPLLPLGVSPEAVRKSREKLRESVRELLGTVVETPAQLMKPGDGERTIHVQGRYPLYTAYRSQGAVGSAPSYHESPPDLILPPPMPRAARRFGSVSVKLDERDAAERPKEDIARLERLRAAFDELILWARSSAAMEEDAAAHPLGSTDVGKAMTALRSGAAIVSVLDLPIGDLMKILQRVDEVKSELQVDVGDLTREGFESMEKRLGDLSTSLEHLTSKSMDLANRLNRGEIEGGIRTLRRDADRLSRAAGDMSEAVSSLNSLQVRVWSPVMWLLLAICSLLVSLGVTNLMRALRLRERASEMEAWRRRVSTWDARMMDRHLKAGKLDGPTFAAIMDVLKRGMPGDIGEPGTFRLPASQAIQMLMDRKGSAAP